MSDDVLRQIRDLIQVDVNGRGLAADPGVNLFNAFPEDFAAACHSIAETPDAAIGVVTGFNIAHVDPPCGETDGPLGALFLARALEPLGIRVALFTDEFSLPALKAGLKACGLQKRVALGLLPSAPSLCQWVWLTHLVALERVGPSRDGACYSMRGQDVSKINGAAHLLFEGAVRPSPLTTIGIGDGGNEIGMGKISAEVIGRNVLHGSLIACRVATDYLIVCGVSNWGAYALAAGVALVRGVRLDPALFDVESEREYLRIMVEQGPLVDGVTGQQTVTVDGLSFEDYVKPLVGIRELLRVWP